MKSHRLPPDGVTQHDVNAYGEDNRNFPTGVNHIQPHTTPRSHPLTETKVGPYIQDVGDSPSVWHGVAPSITREHVEDEWNRRQKEATMTAGDTTPPGDTPAPVPVYLVNPNAGSEGISSWTGSNYDVPATHTTLIAGRDYKRSRLFICNEDAANGIRVSRGISSNNLSGFFIGPGKTQEIATQDTVYAISAHATDPVQVSVLVEYGIDGGN